MRVRIKFEKQGALRFIGHLDVMRYFQKMIRRAGLDVHYSEGYSPHQEMTFATPLGLGLTSRAEYADVEFDSCPGREELIRRLNAVNVPELRILDAALLPDGAKNAMSALRAADYLVSFREGYAPEDLDLFYGSLFEWLERPEIVVEKETKKNRVTVDIKKQILEAERRGDSLFLRVDAGSASNLKPELIYDSFFASEGTAFPEHALLISREELYGEEDGALVPLLSYGRDF